MTRRRIKQAELQPVYVPPNLDSYQRAAARDWRRAACGDERKRPKRGEFDPLWLRLGLRAKLIDDRAGWVVSNPLLDQTLRRSPQLDPSLPGPGWLREVYRWRDCDLVTLPGTLAVIEQRIAVLRAAEEAWQSPRRAEPAAQADLFEVPA